MGTGERKMIWLILLLGLILRLINLNQSLWLDEAINVLAAKNNSFLQILIEYPKFDFHPPGYFLILWGWIRIFGSSEVVVRMPSVIFGLATVYLVFLIGKKLVSKNLGLLAAIFLAVNPLHIYYSQETRMYSLAAFATTLNFLFFIWKIRVGYLVSSLVVLGADYLAYLIFPAQFIFLLLTKQRQFLKFLLITLIIAGLGFWWWIPIFLDQLNVGQATAVNVPAWKMVVGESGIRPLVLTYIKFIIGRISISDNLIYGLVFTPIGILFAFLIWQGLKILNKPNKILLLSWLGIPIILAWLISLVVPIYSYFRLLFVLPAFIILVALGADKLRFKYTLIALVILIEITSASVYLFNPKFHREDWKGLVNFLKSAKTENSKILFESNGSFAPFDYYSGNELKGRGALKNFPAKDLEDLGDLTDLGPSVYLIDYLVEISDPNRMVEKKLTLLNYHQVDIKNFNGVGFVYHYVKR